MHLGACRGQRRRAVVGAGEAEHLMTRRFQLLDNRGTDKSGRAGEKYTHRGLHLCLPETYLRGGVIPIK